MTDQAKSADLCSIRERLERLRVATQSTWAQIALTLGLSESMIYQAKSGKRQLSPKALYRLAQSELKAGLNPPLLSAIEADESEEELGYLKTLLEGGQWTDDIEAQFAAIVGEELQWDSVIVAWDLLRDFLTAFFEGLKKHTPQNLPRYIDSEIPHLKTMLEGFEFNIRRTAEFAKRESQKQTTTPESASR